MIRHIDNSNSERRMMTSKSLHSTFAIRHSPFVRRNPQCAAVTLLEVLLAIGLLTLLSGTTFWFYRNTLESRSEAMDANQKLQVARTLLYQMAEEIRQCSSFTPGYGTGLSGGSDHIAMFTTRLPRRVLSQERTLEDEPVPGEFDLMKVKYYIARHDEIEDEDGYPLALGLVRKETRTLGAGRNREPGEEGEDGGGNGNANDNEGDGSGEFGGGFGEEDEGGDPFADESSAIDEDEFLDPEQEDVEGLTTIKEELYAPEIKYLKFHYFDGSRWWKDWDLQGASTLPQIVRITVGFTPHPPDDEMNEEIDLFLEDPEAQEPLPADEYTMFVRVLQSDIFYSSRIARTAQDLVQQAAEEAQGF